MKKAGSLIVCVALGYGVACGSAEAENAAPVAKIVASATEVEVGARVTLEGSQSADPDGDPLILRWSLEAPSGSRAELNQARGERVEFVADLPGAYNVALVADDGALEASDEVVVNVAEPANRPPIADAGVDINTEPGLAVLLDATGSEDPDGDPLRFAWEAVAVPEGSSAALDDATLARPSFTADRAGAYTFGLRVSDPDGEEDEDTVTVTAVRVNPNDPPVAMAGADQAGEVGRAVRLDASGSTDPNGDTLAYRWALVAAPAGSAATIVDAEQVTASLTPDVVGEYGVELTVDDGEETSTDRVDLSIEPALPCLLISEVFEGAANDKAVEFYNCGSSSLDLSEVGYCIVVNENTTCRARDDLMLAGALAPGEVQVACHPSFEWAAGQQDVCDVRDGVVNFNGDDRLFLFEDTDGSESYSVEDRVIDAFGELANPPTSTIWANANYRRCGFERFRGDRGFDFTGFWVELGFDDKSDLGSPPSEGCP